MYSVKVRNVNKVAGRTFHGEETAGTSDSGASHSTLSPYAKEFLSQQNGNRVSTAPPKGEEFVVPTSSLDFSAGNPRVEHVTGVVHLYRHLDSDIEMSSPEGLVLPKDRSTMLCILALPPDMGFPELCAFFGAYFDHIKEIRLVRRDHRTPRASYLALIQFDTIASADNFYNDLNGKPFCMLEPDLVCRILFVKNVEMYTQQQLCADKTAPTGTKEIPSCPVCLERLDEEVSGIVTTVCNHRFHNQCLRQWGDTSCPVCRYSSSPSEAAARCSACGSSSDLWICLICGHVGCGRYKGLHAANHWQETDHGYALEIETQRVWDYASDAYVHRLIRSKTDGKIVEVPAPGRHSGCCAVEDGPSCNDSGRCHSKQQQLDEDVEEAMVLSKLDVLATEYSHLLVTQLESQRNHFEGLIAQQREEFQSLVDEARRKNEIAEKEASTFMNQAQDALNRQKQTESKLNESLKKLEKGQKEVDFLRQLNETLLLNQKDYATKLKAAESWGAKQEATVAELREQVRDLMVFIEARQTIEAADADASVSGLQSEVRGGTVLPLPQQSGRRKNKGNRK